MSDFECIIVDAASMDLGLDEAVEISQWDKRFRVLHQRNGDLAVARWAGLSAAKGDYVTFLIVPDQLPTSSLATRLEAVFTGEGNLVGVYSDGIKSSDNVSRDSGPTLASALVDRRALLEACAIAPLDPLGVLCASGTDLAPVQEGTLTPVTDNDPSIDSSTDSSLTTDVRPLTPRQVVAGGFGGVVLVPLARYHVDELIPLAEALDELGVHSSILLTPNEGQSVCLELQKYARPAYSWPDDLSRLGQIDAVVSLNDWGPTTQLAAYTRRVGGLVVAKVEGVQDFDDVDTGRQRLPYRHSDFVLCQGPNDQQVLGTEDTEVVGNSRLEAVWHEGERSFERSRNVVINSNFTYGVLNDARSQWLDSVLHACELAGATPIISQHHADRGLDADLPISRLPMKHLLQNSADVLVSRFSTVPFEAMARGVPFVYHNPHQEVVPTFANPEGAFLASDSVESLAAAIDTALGWRGSYRERSQSFFAQQVSISDTQTPHQRAAKAIADRLG